MEAGLWGTERGRDRGIFLGLVGGVVEVGDGVDGRVVCHSWLNGHCGP